jgi:hypothetical protein
VLCRTPPRREWQEGEDYTRPPSSDYDRWQTKRCVNQDTSSRPDDGWDGSCASDDKALPYPSHLDYFSLGLDATSDVVDTKSFE